MGALTPHGVLLSAINRWAATLRNVTLDDEEKERLVEAIKGAEDGPPPPTPVPATTSPHHEGVFEHAGSVMDEALEHVTHGKKRGKKE